MLGKICQNVENHVKGGRRLATHLQRFIQTACRGGIAASKKIQMDIVREMQAWAGAEINKRLEAYGMKLRAECKEHRYTGGWRSVKVDVHIGTKELGLVLALDPKHLRSMTSIRKNWKNMLNDLVAFSANFHSRFPMCVVGGLLGFEKNQATQARLDEIYSILAHVAIRKQASDQHDLMEAFGLAVYECGSLRLSPSIPPPRHPLRCETMFDRLVELLIQRYVR